MTDPKKPRTPRELAPGKAIAMLKAIDADHKELLAEETAKAIDRAAAWRDKRRTSILSSVHETARHGVRAAAGIPDAVEPEEDDFGAAESDPATVERITGEPAIPEGDATVPAAELPRGALPYTPGAAARAARGTR